MSLERMLPRSVLLSLWIEHLEVGAASIENALQAVQADDEPHTVVWPDGRKSHLGELLALWTAKSRQVATVLPAPGDLAGLSGPGRVNTAALEAGEAVLYASAEGSFAAIPQLTEFGSHIEPGYFVHWQITPANSWQQRFLGTIGDWRQAQRELAGAVERAIEELIILNTARWREEVAHEIEALRGTTQLPDPLPRTLDPLRAALLATGWRLAGIADLGQSDDGAAISGWEANRRREALSTIESTARRAVASATFAAPSLM